MGSEPPGGQRQDARPRRGRRLGRAAPGGALGLPCCGGAARGPGRAHGAGALLSALLGEVEMGLGLGLGDGGVGDREFC